MAVVDIVEEKAKRAAERHGVPHYYTDFRRMLERDDIDAVDVCLHNNLHAPVTIAALESGRHVYCEKPIAGSYADGLAIGRGGETLRKNAAHPAVDLVHEGRPRRRRPSSTAALWGTFTTLGRWAFAGVGVHTSTATLRRSSCRRRWPGGGALFDMAVYHIAQILYLIGMPGVERVTGKVYQETPMDEERRRISGYNVEEFAAGFVHLAGGITLDIAESWALHLDGFEGSSIVGSLGRTAPFAL